jgi:hypothetical protein
MSSSIVDTLTYLFVKLLRSMTDHLKIVVENRFHTDFHFILIIQLLFLNFKLVHMITQFQQLDCIKLISLDQQTYFFNRTITKHQQCELTN